MRSQRHFAVSAAIPPALPPTVLVQALQTFKPVIRHLSTLASFEQIPTPADAVSNDPFFNAGAEKVFTYRIHEAVTLAPGISKEANYPTHFQSIPAGCRCRADGNMGIIGWVEFTVRPKCPDESLQEPPRQQQQIYPSPDSTHSGQSSGFTESEEWEIHETLLVEGNSLLLPFIATAIVVSHQGLCNKIIDEVMRSYLEGYDYSSEIHTPVNS